VDTREEPAPRLPNALRASIGLGAAIHYARDDGRQLVPACGVTLRRPLIPTADPVNCYRCTANGPTPAGPRLTLLVLYTSDLETSRAFYEALGLTFTAERHGTGP